jgi:VanZ family protein
MLSEKLKNFLIFYFPVLLWMGFIFYLSSIPSLRSGSESILVETILRKIAHLAEYVILTFLIWRLFFVRFKFSLSKSYWLALGISLLYSIGDEIHQSFVDDRAGKVFDVLVDLLGILIGFLFIKIAYYLFYSKKQHDTA